MDEKINGRTKLSEEQLKTAAAICLEDAKQTLLNEGLLRRSCFIFTISDYASKLPKDITVIETISGDVVGLHLDSDPDSLLFMITEVHPEMKDTLEALKVIGESIGVEDHKHTRLLNGVKRAMKMSDGDIISLFMHHMIEKFDGYAYIHQSECWTREYNVKEEQPPEAVSLAQDPLAKECLVIHLETPKFQQLTRVPFHRTERETGKVVRFEELEVLTSDPDSKWQLGGRIIGALKDTPETSPQEGAQTVQ